jgi:hypothetical protein
MISGPASLMGKILLSKDYRIVQDKEYKASTQESVKLLGFCVEGEEQELVYEDFPNKSLDLFIFCRTYSLLQGFILLFHH